MNNAQRAQQFWSVLVFAAREHKCLGYAELAKMTGMAQTGVGGPLGYIHRYCEKRKLPQLNFLAISQDTGKPSEGCPQIPGDLAEQQARVFVYSWLDRDVPSSEEFEKIPPPQKIDVAS